MTKEEKQLLLKDLCARLPYRTVVQVSGRVFYGEGLAPYQQQLTYWLIEKSGKLTIKPYLRSLSRMTKDERDYVKSLTDLRCTPDVVTMKMDFYLEHFLDNRGLIEKDLALEAPDEMYKIKQL